MIQIIIFFSLIIFSGTLTASEGAVGGGNLFYSSLKKFDRYQIIDGKMIFQKKDSEIFSSGYRPTRSFFIEGEYSETVYDFPESVSSLGVFNDYKNHFISKGFNIIHQCIRTECGDIAGWKLFMSDKIGGRSDEQYYFVARRGTENGNSKTHITLHVSELDEQPRLIVHSIVGSTAASTFESLSKTNSELDNGFRLMHEFFFETGDYTNFDSDNLENLMKELESASRADEIILVGYTDPNGDALSNKRLSLKRAESIRKFFINEFGVDESTLVIINGGEIHSDGDPEKERLSRKVALYYFSPPS